MEGLQKQKRKMKKEGKVMEVWTSDIIAAYEESKQN